MLVGILSSVLGLLHDCIYVCAKVCNVNLNINFVALPVIVGALSMSVLLWQALRVGLVSFVLIRPFLS